MLRAEVVAMVGGDGGADGVRIVHQDGAAHAGEFRRSRVSDGARVDAARLAQERADEVNVVHAVVDDLDARDALEEGEEVPGRVDIEAHLQVEQVAQEALRDEMPRGDHEGGEAELAVDGGAQAPGAADVEDFARLRVGFAHGFLDEHERALRKLPQGVGEHRGGQGQVEDGVRGRAGHGFGYGLHHARHAVLRGQRLGAGTGAVLQGVHREAGKTVGGQMSVLDDAAGAQDDDGKGLRGEGRGVGDGVHGASGEFH